MVKDVLGIQRGECISCGEDECEEFLQDGIGICCGYCSCPPVHHVNKGGSKVSKGKPTYEIKQVVKDIKGIQRGYCRDCGVAECPLFMLDCERGMKCAYCKCAPVRHVKIGSSLDDGRETTYLALVQHVEDHVMFQLVKEIYLKCSTAGKIAKDLCGLFFKMGKLYIIANREEQHSSTPSKTAELTDKKYLCNGHL